MHNETLFIVAMRVNKSDRSPIGIDRGDAAPTPTGFAQIVSDDFPVLHDLESCLESTARQALAKQLEVEWLGWF